MVSDLFNPVNFIQYLDSHGWLTDSVLPFLLVFVIIFAILQKTKILGSESKKFNVVVSLVIGLLVIIPHITGMYGTLGLPDIVEIMRGALPQVSLIVVAIVMLMILVGLMGAESNWFGGALSGWIAIVAFIIVVIIFGGAAFGWSFWYTIQGWLGEDAIAIIIMLLVFGIIIWWVTRPDSKENAAGFFSNVGKAVSDMMKPKK